MAISKSIFCVKCGKAWLSDGNVRVTTDRAGRLLPPEQQHDRPQLIYVNAPPRTAADVFAGACCYLCADKYQKSGPSLDWVLNRFQRSPTPRTVFKPHVSSSVLPTADRPLTASLGEHLQAQQPPPKTPRSPVHSFVMGEDDATGRRLPPSQPADIQRVRGRRGSRPKHAPEQPAAPTVAYWKNFVWDLTDQAANRAPEPELQVEAADLGLELEREYLKKTKLPRELTRLVLEQMDEMQGEGDFACDFFARLVEVHGSH